MTACLVIRSILPGATLQDLGRPGYLAAGLSRGGAADRLAMAEGAALLGQDVSFAAIEFSGAGGIFEATGALRIALTGADMPLRIDGAAVACYATHHVEAGSRIEIGGARKGVYGYLHLGGGIDGERLLGSCAAHLTAGLFGPLEAGVRLPAGKDPHVNARPVRIAVDDRLSGGEVRLLPVPQTGQFTPDELARFEATQFRRGARGNRQGVLMESDVAPFSSEGQLTLVSDVIQPGDVQITGDGRPFVLMPECQTTGGYPRIGTVHPMDLPRVAQAAPGTLLRFLLVDRDGEGDMRTDPAAEAMPLRKRVTPLVRAPSELTDLHLYQLISGVTAGWHDEEDME